MTRPVYIRSCVVIRAPFTLGMSSKILHAHKSHTKCGFDSFLFVSCVIDQG